MSPHGTTASTHEVRTRRSTNRWRLAQVATALAVAGLLAACSQDQTNQRSLTRPKDGAAASSSPDAGPHEWNLTNTDPDTIYGAIWNPSESFQVGTGNLDPFLQIQDSPNEEGFNTNATKVLDDGSSANFNHALPLNHIPVISKGGVLFRELILDANEANSLPDAQFSIDKFNIWLCNDANATGYDTRDDFENNTNCALVYGLNQKNGGPVLDGTAGSQPDTLLASDAASRGSGNQFDYQILIPDGAFQAAAVAVNVNANTDCSYNGNTSASCGSYIVLDTKMGYKGGAWVTGSTFEEFSTIERPWVTVTKTATPSLTRRYNWTIQKTVDPTDIYLFDGQSQQATWNVTVAPGTPAFTDSNWQLAGSINIANTSGSTVTILSITDQLSDALGSVNLSCPSGTGPVTLANNATYTCTYTKSFASAPSDGAHSNTATVTLDDGAGLDPSAFTGSQQFNFANATLTEIDKDPPVKDTYNSGTETTLGNASTGTFTFQHTYTCNADNGSFTNTARVDITNPPADPTATATLNVHCLSLTVTKTAVTSNTRTYQWTIAKSATPTSWTLFNGDAGTTNYTVTVAPGSPQFIDSNNQVTGSITVHNPNSVTVYIQSVTDAISGAGAPAVTPNCGGASFAAPGYALAAGADLVCTYSASLPDGTTRTNTATASAKPTSTGTAKNFTGTASIDFSTATLNEVNKTVHVTDNFNSTGDVALGTVTNPNTGTFHPTHTFTCNADAGTFPNTAKITETSQTATASVTVTCRALTVTKTATTTWRRSWTWGVTKTINPTSTDLTLDLNQSYIVGYTVTYTQNAPTDDQFRASGTVTLTNPASGGPAATTTATINSLADVITGPISAALSCGVTFPTTLAAGSSINCTYTNVALPDKTTRTNTATATRQEHSFSSTLVPTNTSTIDYSGTASVSFASSPTFAVDQCVNVADTNPGTTVTGSTCVNKTFTYNKTLQYATCGNFTVPNTASFTTTPGTAGTTSNTATPLTGSASVTINVTVPCPQGCTLTLGYWKTHNASFKGGAPPDDNWDNIVTLKELTGFFTTWSPSYPEAGPNSDPNFNWFNVFWTAPKGNAYYILSQQYMAAKLNYLNGAGQLSSVTAAITAAEDFFSHAGDTPADWATTAYKTKSDLIGWAGILGSYNEGTIGPGHCSEDNTSAK